MHRLILYTLSIALLVIAISSDTYAKSRKFNSRGHENSLVQIAIPHADRLILRDYLRSNYRPSCPPGLAKKHNGCLPPGIAKKYAMGRPLPPGIDRKHLPGDILNHLQPIAGYDYIQVDRDVLLISEATQKVVDAVTLLSAIQ